MNTQRLTISLPAYIYEQLTLLVRPRQISRFVTHAVEKQLLEEKTGNPIHEFTSLRHKLPKFTRKHILAAIQKGRQ